MKKDLLIVAAILLVIGFIKYHPGVVTKESVKETVTMGAEDAWNNRETIMDTLSGISVKVNEFFEWFTEKFKENIPDSNETEDL